MSLLDEVTSSPAYALIKFQETPTVTLLGGRRSDYETLDDVPLCTGEPPAGRLFDRLLCVPYAQIRERGFAVHADDAPLSSIEIDTETAVPLADTVAALPEVVPLTTVGPVGFDLADDAYADLVGRVVRDEIGRGEGANLVIARN
ncbi:MAG: phenazine-specific anthranilate synthase component I, partial [Solirubrobacterales bacterium]|nr:phenazine-specific anthranilate synthase component I [Solirubrobacterales bacterium]